MQKYIKQNYTVYFCLCESLPKASGSEKVAQKSLPMAFGSEKITLESLPKGNSS